MHIIISFTYTDDDKESYDIHLVQRNISLVNAIFLRADYMKYLKNCSSNVKISNFILQRFGGNRPRKIKVMQP